MSQYQFVKLSNYALYLDLWHHFHHLDSMAISLSRHHHLRFSTISILTCTT